MDPGKFIQKQFYVRGILLGTDDTVVNKIFKASAFMVLTFQRGSITNHQDNYK